MPFLNLSGEPAQDYFIDGVVEDIVSALSRIRWLFVIAGNASFTYKGRMVDVKQVGREHGGCYVLEGSLVEAEKRGERESGVKGKSVSDRVDRGGGGSYNKTKEKK